MLSLAEHRAFKLNWCVTECIWILNRRELQPVRMSCSEPSMHHRDSKREERPRSSLTAVEVWREVIGASLQGAWMGRENEMAAFSVAAAIVRPPVCMTSRKLITPKGSYGPGTQLAPAAGTLCFWVDPRGLVVDSETILKRERRSPV